MKNPEHKNFKVSVIIPTIGRSSINRSLEAIEKQTKNADEVIVVRDELRQGAGWARNEGIRRSHGELIAFLDDDCEPPADWIEKLADAIDRNSAAGAGGTYNETDPFWREINSKRKFPEVEKEDNIGIVGTGGNIMYRRSWLESVLKTDGHIFNEEFKNSMGGEDIELAWRLRCMGGKMIFVPCRVTHLKMLSSWGYLKLTFNRGIGIFHLYEEQIDSDNKITAGKSLLWSERSSPITKLLKILWKKVLGPFDFESFSRLDYFLLFWLGEKTESAGFLWGMVLRALRIK